MVVIPRPSETILDLNNEDARRFLLRSDNYCNCDFPQYFDFQPLLDALANSKDIPRKIEQQVKNKKAAFKSFTAIFADYSHDEVNYVLYSNKNGNLNWRPLQLINPVAYVYLVNIITEERNWKHIRQRFKKFQENSNIVCCSIPLVGESGQNKRNAITNWTDAIEKTSIKMSLEYNYILITDIANCYGSIYTHSIAWALHRKGKSGAKNELSVNKNAPKIWNAIDVIIQNISNRQTNGIPQGSTTMDLIAEMVLGYADLELSNRLKDQRVKKDSYKILRFKDDYRIFTKTKEDAEKIARILSETLSDLSLELNESKTIISDDIITASQKTDKIAWRSEHDGHNDKKLEDSILQIYQLSKEYPNSGAVEKALSCYYEKFDSCNTINEDLNLIASTAAEIAHKNPRTYPYVVAILGKVMSMQDGKESSNLLKQVRCKFNTVPYTEYLSIWLQRLFIKGGKTKMEKISIDSKLCTYVNKYINQNVNKPDLIWKHYTGKNANIKKIFEQNPIINSDIIKDMESRPKKEELVVFQRYI